MNRTHTIIVPSVKSKDKLSNMTVRHALFATHTPHNDRLIKYYFRVKSDKGSSRREYRLLLLKQYLEAVQLRFCFFSQKMFPNKY